MDKRWWTLVAVCLGTFMLLLDITIVNVALPQVEQSLHASFSDLQWVVDAYALTLAALLLTAGSLADRYGRRLVFVAGVALFSAGSLLCGFATSPLFLILSRGGQGVGGAAMFATALALLANAFHGRERGVALAAWGAVTGIAVAIGPVAGGLITSSLSWRWIFFVNVPIGAVAVVVAVAQVVESRAAGAEGADVVGLVLFTAALGSLVYGLIRASETAWTDTGVLACFALAALLLAGFVLAERHRPHPMFDLSLFRVPTFVGGLVAAFGIAGSVFALLLYLVLYLQDILGYDALQAGVRLIVISGGVLATSAIAGRLTARVPLRYLVGTGLLVSAAGLGLMTGTGASSGWTHLIPGFLVAGLGTGIVNPPLASTAVGVVEPARAGMASGINSTLRQVGIATGIAALGSLLATKERSTIAAGLSALPRLRPAAGQIEAAAHGGALGAQLAAVPPALRPAVVHLVRAGFTAGLNEILAVGAVLAAAAGVASLALIRNRDLVGAGRPTAPAAGDGAAGRPSAAAAGKGRTGH